MIGLATHKRPHNMVRFIAAYGITQAKESVLVMIDEDDDSYKDVVFPENFIILKIPRGCSASRRANIPFEKFPDEPYYAIMGDDVVPMTNHWDSILRERAGEWKIAYCDDGINGHRLATHPFIGGELVRAQGYVEEPTMGDWYADNCRMDIGRALHILDYVEEVKFDHMHPLNGKSEHDETYAKQQGKTPELYEFWRRTSYHQEVRRLRLAYEASKYKMS